MAPTNPRLDFLTATPPPNYVAGLGRGATGFTTPSDNHNPNFDKFEGNDAGLLFSYADYDAADKEADAIWESIDRKMDSKRKLNEEIQTYHASNPTIYEHFRDLKLNLHALTAGEGIPDLIETSP